MAQEFTTREIQEQLLVVLKEFDQLCRENGIKYSLHGGTLLGAIREKGFISWDDDADISMTRDEYEKLLHTLENNRYNANLKVTYDINHVPKAILIEKTSIPVWIDIFVYDYITKQKILQQLKIKILAVLSVFVKPKGGLMIRKAIYQFPKWMRIPYYMIYAVGNCFPLNGRVRFKEWFAKYCFCGSKELVHRSNDQYLGLSEIFPLEVVKNYQMVPFEGTQLMVFCAYKDILTASYGKDYMTPVKYNGADGEIHARIRDTISSGNGGG